MVVSANKSNFILFLKNQHEEEMPKRIEQRSVTVVWNKSYAPPHYTRRDSKTPGVPFSNIIFWLDSGVNIIQKS